MRQCLRWISVMRRGDTALLKSMTFTRLPKSCVDYLRAANPTSRNFAYMSAESKVVPEKIAI